jgi:hypothetical protein
VLEDLREQFGVEKSKVFVNANAFPVLRRKYGLWVCCPMLQGYTSMNTAYQGVVLLPSAPLSANRSGRVAEGFSLHHNE